MKNIETIVLKKHKAQEILGKLISFPCIGGQSNLPIAKYIEAYLIEQGVSFHNVPNEDGTKRSIHCRIGPAIDGGIILSGHMDVVPVEGQNWQTNPFEQIEKEGKLYGRGSCDMKGFLACCLAVLPEMLAADLKKPIYFAFSYDEEIGCFAGPALAKSIKDTYSEKPEFAIIGEPTNMKTIIAEKGMGTIETTIYSRSAHSSQIRTEVSAIHEAARMLLWLENRMEEIINSGQIDNRFDPPHSTLNIGRLNGGTAHNIIAEKCTFLWDIRNIPADSVPEFVADFEAYCEEKVKNIQKNIPEFNITHKALFPPVPALDTAITAAIIPFVNQLNGATKTAAVSFASEAGQFSEAGFETVLCGPGSIEQAHRVDEFLELEQLGLCVQFMQNLVKVLE